MNTGSFPPPKRLGLLVHILILLAFAALGAWALYNLTRLSIGPAFLLYLLAVLLALAPLPFFGYRTFSLLRADYVLDRDSLAIYWGLRVEDIPLTDIEWIRPAEDLTSPLPLPTLGLPGGLLGLRRHRDIGPVEFIASGAKNILVIATAKQVYAISPADPGGFLAAFRRATELGSLLPADAVSRRPSFMLARAWDNSIVRFLWLMGFLLNIGLIAWVSFLVPALNVVSLGFDVTGAPLEAVPSARLILLPVLSGLLFATGFITGLFLYRDEEKRPLAVLIWLSGALSGVSFLLAVLFIVTAPA